MEPLYSGAPLLEKIMRDDYGLDMDLILLAEQVEAEIEPEIARIRTNIRINQLRVLQAFREEGVTEYHLKDSNGYGYGDLGREGLDRIYAQIFGGEVALVRLQMVSGTHALAVALFGNLRPGEELVSVTGPPYDTLNEIIGAHGENPVPGSLTELGVSYRELDLTLEGQPDLAALERVVNKKTKMVYIQRSSGYSWRPALTVETIETLIRQVKALNPQTLVLVDNCYGEFVQASEPGMAGADLTVGSLIKNPGGGLAPSGGYIVGGAKEVEAAAQRLTAPGLGGHLGATLGVNRWFYQGLFLAPQVVGEALRGALFAARLFEKLGYTVQPLAQAPRGDIIQAIRLGTPEALNRFCQAIQGCSPIDSMAIPIFDALPGYEQEVIMAAGTFVQGASIELSADAPLRPPYIAYLQGGLTFEHARIAILSAAQALRKAG